MYRRQLGLLYMVHPVALDGLIWVTDEAKGYVLYLTIDVTTDTSA